MQKIADWLKKLGMSEYAERFAENDIDIAVLPDLTDQHLKDLGISLGHRLKLLRAIRDLGGASVAATALSAPVATGPTQRHEAERRQLTVMFCDLVGSTALSTKLDPEDLRCVIGAYQKCVAEAVTRFDGFVAKYMGDGVLVYFGYPCAHEDNAERAVRAGMALIEAAGKLRIQERLQVRVGIATGLVVVGDLIGAGAAQEQAVIGETPNLAARFQALAEPGAIVIGSRTRRLTGGLFEYRDLGTVALKGFAENVRAWQVLGAGSAESRFEALRATSTPLIGRSEEMDLLMRRWEQAKRGAGSAVLVSGEPGIGKSRIAQTIVERLGGEPHTPLRLFCSPHHRDSALHPTTMQLERAAGFRREDTAEQRLEKLEDLLRQATNDLGEALPLLASLLSIPGGDRCPPLDLSPQKQKEKTLKALLAQVEGLAVQRPVLMVYEDVQWSDPTTRESLDLLIERVVTLRVLLVITFRPEFTPPWVGRPHVTLLSLNPLPPRRGAEMIARLTFGKALPKEIADQIIDHTDGIPLFIEELTKAVIESDILTETADRYVVAGQVAPLAIPTTLHASLLARLDRLAPTREVAQIAAALGRRFSHELISAVATLPKQQLDDSLMQLVHAELIFRRGTPPDAEYTFKHALVQDAAYSTLLRSRRQQLHARIAATLEDQFSEIVAAQPALLARHYAEAGLAENAVIYWLKAAQRALARSAMTEGVAHLRKGLDELAILPDGPSRRQQELDLQITLGPVLAGTKGWSAPEVGQAFARARALAEQINRPEYLAGLIMGQWAFHLVRSEHKLALSLAGQLKKIGEARNDIRAQLLGCRADGEARFYLGEFVATRVLLDQCHGLADPAHRVVGVGRPADHYALMLAHLGVTLAFLGLIDQARSRLNEAFSEARRLRYAHTLAEVLLNASCIESITRSHEMQWHVEELVAVSTEHDLPYYLGYATVYRGTWLTVLGQAQEGLRLLTQGLTALRATETVIGTPGVLIGLAAAYAMIGQPAEGLNCLAEAAQIIEMTEERCHEAELYRTRGDLLNAIGDQDVAEQSYRQALAVAERQSAKLLELIAATGLARLWRDQGKRTEARNLLAPIHGWFTEGFDTPVLQDAKALLDQLA
jgi:class 3 adenylate cyclase/tetratricopeptide (TPR) repeat protein